MKRISSSHLAPLFGLLLCLSACFHNDDTEIPTPLTGDHTWALVGQGPLDNTTFLGANFGNQGSWAGIGFQFDDAAGNGGFGEETPFVFAGTRSGSLAWFHSLRNGPQTIWPTSIDISKDGLSFVSGGFSETLADTAFMTGEVLVHLDSDGSSPWGINTNDGQHTIDLTASRGIANGCFILGTNNDGTGVYSYLVGVTAAGTIAWGKESLNDITEEQITLIRSYDDGSCLIAGNRVDNLGGTGAFVARILSTGAERWWSYVDSEEDSVLVDAQPISGGGAIVVLDDGGDGLIVARLNSLGNMTFAKRVSHPLGNGLALYESTSSNDQTICIAATSDGAGGQDPVVFALNSDGEESWAWQITAGQDLVLISPEPSTLGFYLAGVTEENIFSLATTTDAVFLEINSKGELGNEDCLITIALSLSVLDANVDSSGSIWDSSSIADPEDFFSRIDIGHSSPSSTLKQVICESAGS